MDITSPKSLTAQQAHDDHHRTDDEVVADAPRLMATRDEAVQMKRVLLRDAISRGYEDLIAGRVIALENEDQIDAFFADL